MTVAVESRTDRVVELLDERGLDSLLVSNLVNVRYLTGFTGTNGACVVSRDERVFITDFRYVEQAGEQVKGYERVKGERDLLGDIAARLRGRAGFDDAHVSVRMHARLLDKVGDDVTLEPAAGLVEQVRLVKDEGEIELIREAARIADAALERLGERGLAGRTEREVARTLVRDMEDLGADGPSFPPIVASGAHGALPHAVPRDVEIPEGELVVIDWGAVFEGYCSDCTRTLATGEVGDSAREVYELVERAQAAALDAVRAGAGRREVDAVARDMIEAAGHGEHFGHGLGHGVGLEIHEEPRLARTAEGELDAGTVVTIEPGVYVPGEVGVRIEDLVVVTEDGGDVLTGFPKGLTVVA